MAQLKVKNELLARLSTADRKRLGPHLEEVPLAFKHVLYEPGQAVSHVYFPESGVISLITALSNEEAIETGTVGKEGFVGLAAVLGVRHATGRAICQIPGRAFRLPADVMARERETSTPWFRLLLRFAHFVNAMSAQGAACNRLHQVDARMSRWLLMTLDRIEGNEFPLTQDFLSQMLGVARPTVNIAGATLQRAGFIRYTRGRVAVLDRTGLESAACDCYARVRAELEATLGSR